MTTIADPGQDDGRILSVDGVRLPSPDADYIDAKPVRPVKPRSLTDANTLLIESGQGSSWWSTVG